MSEINLLQSQSTFRQVKEKSKRWLLRVATLVFILTLALYGYLFYSDWSGQRQIAEHEQVIAETQASLENNAQRSELIARQGQLRNATELIEAHLFWSGLLPELARVTLASAEYSTIETTEEGDLNLTVTVPTYSDAEKYLQVFDLPEYNRYFSNVRVMALSRSQKDNILQTTMRLQLTMDQALLKKSN